MSILVKGIFSEHIDDQVSLCTKHLKRLGINYDFQKLESTQAGSGKFRTAVWKEMVFNKVKHNLQTLKTLPLNQLVIFMDMDVMPLQHFDALSKYVDSHDVCFMREGWKTNHVNTGFILCKVTQNTINLFEDWHQACQNCIGNSKFNGNQGIFNFNVRNKYENIINRFPNDVISRDCVNNNTIAFHAIGKGDKILKMQGAFDRFESLKIQNKS